MKKLALGFPGRGSFKQQIIVVFVLGFFLLVTAFITYMTKVESDSLYRENDRAVVGLAQSLSVSSRSWVLANDVAGMQEVIHSFLAYPELRYAMILSRTGRVLAHSDPEKVGLFLADPTSQTLTRSPAANQFLINSESMVDVAVPIQIGQRHVGWARVALGRDRIIANIQDVARRGVIFVLLSGTLAFLAALLIASRLGARIGSLVQVAEGVRTGNFGVRASIAGRTDEITRLADSFNRMLDTLEKNELDLQTASRYSRSLIEANLDPLMTINPDGNITDVNHASEKATGRRREELIGTDFSDYFTEPDKAREVCAQALLKEKVTDYPLSILHTTSGCVTDVLYNATVFRNEAGEVMGVFAAGRDITEKKLADEQIRRSQQSLAEAQQIARLGNWELDLASNALTWSDEMYRIFEIDPESCSLTYAVFLDLIHPDDRKTVDNAYTESVRNRKPYDIEHRLLMKDGRIKFVNEKCVTYYGEDGRPLRSVGTMHDITELKLKEEELRRYKDHLEEEVQHRTADLILARNAAEAANKAKSVFLANMSHELRTPLNAILGFSNMMRKEPLLEAKQKQNLDIISRSGEHLLTLINDVLDMAKIEAGRVQLEEAPFDLGCMVRDITDMMQIRAQEKGLRLLIDQSSKFPRYIVGDEARLRQVLINLLGNAVKFTMQGGVTIRLGVKPDKEPLLVMEVEDSGPGIAPEDQVRVFEPFVQLGEQGANKGTGLGLTITRQFVQLMKGRLSLESTLGKGSIFRVELPLKQAAESDIVKPGVVPKGEVSSLAPGQPEYRILIVEDQRDNQLLLSRLLEAVGFKFKVAENGKQGVQMFQEWHPHFIWMDRRMPVMDGLEATRQIRSLPGGKDVKIVAVTASAFQEQRAELIEAGMDDFVRKPYRSSEIYESLLKHLGVQYVYEGIPEPAGKALALTPDRLSGLPQELLDEMKDALESLESARIASVLQKVATYDEALQKSLASLVENFDYPAILKALPANQHA